MEEIQEIQNEYKSSDQLYTKWERSESTRNNSKKSKEAKPARAYIKGYNNKEH